MRRGGVVAWLLAGLALALAPPAAANDGTQQENARAGDPLWFPDFSSRVRWGQTGASEAIEGYADDVSVVAGQSLNLRVRMSDPAGRYRIYVRRLGWYGGDRNRVLACIPANCSGDMDGDETQPAPPAEDPAATPAEPIAAGWDVTDTVQAGASWASGYYVAELRVTAGPNTGDSYQIPFIVRSPAPNPDAILVAAATNTWQAYNWWGGRSLYERPGSSPLYVGHHHEVSYDRPYVRFQPTLYKYEVQLLRFLEREGFEVEYTTNVDVDRDPASVGRHPLAVSVGHDEYWSLATRTAFDQARDAGTNLIFAGSNNAYWLVRHGASATGPRRTVVSYKDDWMLDPLSPPTRRFREPGVDMPECAIEGMQFQGGYDWEDDLTPARHYTVVANALAHPWMQGTGLTAGETLVNAVGYEWDARVPGCDPGSDVTVFFRYSNPAEPEGQQAAAVGPLGDKTIGEASVYTAPSGARVFATGSMQFTWLLDDAPGGEGVGRGVVANPEVQAFFLNVVRDLARRRPGTDPPPGGGTTTPPGSGTTTPPGGPTTTPPGSGTPPDTSAPSLRLGLASSIRLGTRRTISLRARCGEACRLSATGTLRGARTRLTRLTARSRSATAGRTVTLALRLSRAQAAAVRRALRRRARVTVAITVTARDASGNRRSTRRTLRLR